MHTMLKRGSAVLLFDSWCSAHGFMLVLFRRMKTPWSSIFILPDKFYPSHSLSLSDILLYSVNGRPKENKIFNPFVKVNVRFLSVSHWAMSVSHSANALLIRQSPFNPAESFVHVQNLERTPPEKGARWMYTSHALACVMFGTCAFLVLYLFSLHRLMSGGPDSQPDHYLTCNGTFGGVPDTGSMFSGWLLTRNAWKLTNNGFETVVHRTKLMIYTWQNFQLHDFELQ